MAGHTYWRLFITACPQGTFTNIRELQFRDIVGLPQMLGGTPLESSHFASAVAANAFDDNPSTWESDAGLPAWIGYHFPMAISVREIYLKARADQEVEMTPTEMTVQYSDNGVDWTTEWDIPIQSGWSLGEVRTFLNPNQGPLPMTAINLKDTADLIASYGRGVVFYAPKWTPLAAPALVMTQLGITEGDIVINTNSTTAGLTIPELTGPAVHEMDYTGENPVIEVPLFLADPDLLAVVSPSGSAHGGRSRRGAVREYTIAVFPEALFLKDDAEGIVDDFTVAYDAAGAWTFNSIALDAERQRLLDSSFWLWRAVFNRPPRRFRGGAGDDKKNIETVSIQGLYHKDMPEGHHQYTTGDPFDASIDLNGTA